jgi:hypothetical protein
MHLRNTARVITSAFLVLLSVGAGCGPGPSPTVDPTPSPTVSQPTQAALTRELPMPTAGPTPTQTRASTATLPPRDIILAKPEPAITITSPVEVEGTVSVMPFEANLRGRATTPRAGSWVRNRFRPAPTSRAS